jgi:hypothetical protein
MEAIWVAAEMHASAAYAHAALILDTFHEDVDKLVRSGQQWAFLQRSSTYPCFSNHPGQNR